MESTCDVCDRLGDDARVLPAELVHLGGMRRFAGEVETVRCHEDNSRLKELVATAGRGRVLVVDGGGSMGVALLGDSLAGQALENGWSGIVVHGCVRDTEALAALDLGVMALGACPRRSRKEGQGIVGVPIVLGSTACMRGDTLVADEDGAVVVAARLLSR